MSLKIDKDFLSTRDINKIKNDCFVEGTTNDYGPPETLRAYGETQNSLYIPFAYAKQRFKASPNKEQPFPSTNYIFKSAEFPFRTDGGRDQEIVFNDAKNKIRGYRSVLLSLYCGFGKCLAKDTPVLMYDGQIKMVQDIEIGEFLMGDDSTPRRVLSTNKGRETLYRIDQENGESYVVNKSHILSLWGENKVDITLADYLQLTEESKDRLSGYKVPVEFKPQTVPDNPYNFGFYIITQPRMEKNSIPTVFKINSRRVRLELLAGIIDAGATLLARESYVIHYPYPTLLRDITFVARSLGFKVTFTGEAVYISGTIVEIPVKLFTGIRSSNPSLLTPISVTELGEGDYYGFQIDGNRRFLLGDFTVTHNTYLGIRLASESGLKCAVLAHRGILIDQWRESIEKFTNAKVQQVDTSGELDPEADFYIFNTAYVHKRWHKGWVLKKLGCYKEIGMLIVDEAHVACASEVSRALLYFNPRIAIALTATPIRKDGLDKVLELYFGEYTKTRIIRIAQDPFTVYRLPTGVKPSFTRNTFGKKDWNSVIKSLVEDSGRNDLIIRLVQKFADYNILILTKRKSHCIYLSERLRDLQIKSTVMVGVDKAYDKEARVLLSTYSKLGVGFDDARLNMLIVACSVTEVEQYAGRLRDAVDKQRVIIDLVDDDPNCQSHWNARRQWYISRNGIVKHYYRSFPEERPAEQTEPEKPKRLARRIEN